MNERTLLSLITLGEGFTTEFKRSFPSDLSTEICTPSRITPPVEFAKCRDYGVAEPVIEVSEHWVTMTFQRPSAQIGEQVTAHVRDQVHAGPESGPESLELRVLALLIEEPLSRSAIADGLGHQSVSAGLNRVIRNLVRDRRIAYTVPDKPGSRLQKYRITPAGRSALEEPAK